MTYVRSELRRRRTRSASTIIGFAVAIALAIVISSLAHGIDAARANAVRPLARLGTDLLVSRRLQTSGSNSVVSDAEALQAEQAAVDQANLLDISMLGAPGDAFSHDFFLPSTLPTFNDDIATQIEHLPRVRSVARGLVVEMAHREGVVPRIVAEFTLPARVIDLGEPTPEEQAASDACVARLPPTQQTTLAIFACLPQRLREVQTEKEVLRQVLGAPETDIRTSSIRLGGVDTSRPTEGLLSTEAMVRGSFFGADSSHPNAVVSEGYAERVNLGVGSTVEVHGSSFTVIGVARPPVGAVACDVYLPLDQLQTLADRQARISMVLVRTKNASDVRQVGRDIAGLFPAARVTDASQTVATVNGSLIVAGYFADYVRLALIGLVLLGAGSNAWLLTHSAVRTRTAELGVLRAIGWRRWHVMQQVLAESAVLAAIGSAVGMAVGVGASQLGAGFAPVFDVYDVQLAARQTVHVAPQLDPREFVVTVLVGLSVAIAAALLGGWKASRIAPGHALRDIE